MSYAYRAYRGRQCSSLHDILFKAYPQLNLRLFKVY